MYGNAVPLEGRELIPQEFSNGLKEIVYSDLYPELEEQRGHYDKVNKSIVLLRGARIDDLVHEYFHHWDLSLALGTDGTDDGSGDVSQMFYGISWTQDKIGREINGSDYRKVKMSRDGFDKSDFVNDYGLCNRLEDLATYGGAYVSGDDLREYARQQMEEGNFEPAIKYLFIRYLTPMKGKEYNLSENSKSLGFEEVKKKLRSLRKNNPQKLHEHTEERALKIFDMLYEIEKLWQKPEGIKPLF
jgi:hypothetical protein